MQLDLTRGMSMPSKTRRLAAYIVALAGLSPVSPVLHAADTNEVAELQEVVVVAQRRSEKVQDVPIAVTAISADDLIERGVRQAGDITSVVPNMLLNSPYGPEAQP